MNDAQPGIRRLGPPCAAFGSRRAKTRTCRRRDATRGRKQYRYHARWRGVRDDAKYGRVLRFGQTLTRIRRRVARDLAKPGLPRDKVLATVVRLLERTSIRIGNEEYARANASYGLTKSGVPQEVALSDRRLAGIVRRMQDLPGGELFHYVGEEGETRGVESADVNAYLRAISGAQFTSKDFRTWAGTLLCARALDALSPATSQAEARKRMALAVDAVARALRNKHAVCRSCYIHPAVFESYLGGRLQIELHGVPRRKRRSGYCAKQGSPDARHPATLGHAVCCSKQRRSEKEKPCASYGSSRRQRSSSGSAPARSRGRIHL